MRTQIMIITTMGKFSPAKPLIVAALAVLFLTGLRLGEANAANYVIYLHGRSMNSWPGKAYLGIPSSWSHAPISYNGSARLLN